MVILCFYLIFTFVSIGSWSCAKPVWILPRNFFLKQSVSVGTR